MKKIILTILLLLISTSALAVEPIDWSKSYALSTAMQAVVSAGGAAATATCDTAQGSTNEGASTQAAKNFYDCAYFTASSSCTVNTIKFYGQGSGGAGVAKLCLYTDSGSSAPQTLLATTGEVALTSGTPGWYQGSISAQTLSSGSKYWVCALTGANSAYLNTAGGASGISIYLARTYGDGCEETWPGGHTNNTKIMGIYAISE